MVLNEFSLRRQRLMAKITSGAIILTSAPPACHHNDVEHIYRQDSEFYYFTGFPEPESLALIVPDHPEHRFILFVRPRHGDAETWSGARIGVAGAQAEFGADVAYPIDELDQHLPKYLEKADRLYYHFGRHEAFNQKILHHYRQLLASFSRRGTGPTAIMDSFMITTPLRQIKSAYELVQIQKAIDISIVAHHQARQLAQPGVWEYQVQAKLEGIFRDSGAMGVAYPSIVASGANACILHYVDNNRQLAAGDLLLIDAGCSYNYYNADITRTFPIDGKFSSEQRELYAIVLAAQKAAITAVQPDNTWYDVHSAALRVIIEGLVSLELLTGSVEEIINKEAYKPFYMHRTSHWLGLDVHDAGFYKLGEVYPPLAAGMVITVEPGIYISTSLKPAADQPAVPDRWQGIGIRIEDDVLVSAEGPQVLTAHLSKSIEEFT